MKTIAASKTGLTSLENINPDEVDRSTITWHKKQLKDILHTLWTTRSGMRMPFNVYTSRMINSLRRHFDYAGYSLHARTELKSGRLVVWIKVKSKGNRPSR